MIVMDNLPLSSGHREALRHPDEIKLYKLFGEDFSSHGHDPSAINLSGRRYNPEAGLYMVGSDLDSLL